jgi:FkbM family methyltransferase
MAGRDLGIKTVIDVGASDGRWSLQAMRCWPDANYLLIDANPVHEPALRAFTQQHPRTHYVLAAAGPSEGEVYFDASDPLGGLASATPLVAPKVITVPQVTLDATVAGLGLPGPYLLKLDTHGYERHICEGAGSVLAQTALIVSEAYGFPPAADGPRFYELCTYLADKGFRPADLAEFNRRPSDGILWQMDLFFLRAERPEFAYTEHR